MTSEFELYKAGGPTVLGSISYGCFIAIPYTILYSVLITILFRDLDPLIGAYIAIGLGILAGAVSAKRRHEKKKLQAQALINAARG